MLFFFFLSSQIYIKFDINEYVKCLSFLPEIEFKEGDTEHFVEVEILYDSVREMREAFTVHLKPDENMVAETKVQIMLSYNLTVKFITTWLYVTLEGSSSLFSINIVIIALAFQSIDEQSHNLY